MAIINKLDFSGLNLNPIPLEFTQKLTTTEWLCAVQKTVNDTVEYVNNLESVAQDYTDVEIEKVKTIIDSNQNAMNVLINQVETNAKAYTDQQINATVTLVNTYVTNITNELTILTGKCNELDYQMEILYNLLQQGVVYVINPVTGEKVQIQNAINALYELINSNDGNYFTAEMYDLLAITANDYEALQVSARSYDSNWQTIFYS